jgi:hypothetical protein
MRREIETVGDGRRGRPIGVVLVAVGVCLAGTMLLAGCGGGSGGGSTASTVAADQLQEARQQGEAKAEERDRVAALQRQVRTIKRRLRHHPAHQAAAPAAAVAGTSEASPPAAEGPIRSFHAPSGNVSCEVFSDGATCTVDSIGESFVLEAGATGRIESAAVLPRDLGELVEYGNTVTAGSITCEVPPSDVPRGITCVDQSDGHGFEASRIPSRQAAY